MVIIMKRKIKCYMAYTTLLYRILGLFLIPCVFWILCAVGSWAKYEGAAGAASSGDGGMYAFYFVLSVYVLFYEIFTDYWVLGGCLSDAGRGLRYFRTSRRGVEVMRNIVLVDLIRRFIYCMIFSAILFVITGWKTAIVMGLAMYCVIVAVLNGSRHVDGLQRSTAIVILAQIGMTIVNLVNVALIELAGNKTIALVCLAVFYCAAGVCVSMVMVRRITARIRSKE